MLLYHFIVDVVAVVLVVVIAVAAVVAVVVVAVVVVAVASISLNNFSVLQPSSCCCSYCHLKQLIMCHLVICLISSYCCC